MGSKKKAHTLLGLIMRCSTGSKILINISHITQRLKICSAKLKKKSVFSFQDDLVAEELAFGLHSRLSAVGCTTWLCNTSFESRTADNHAIVVSWRDSHAHAQNDDPSSHYKLSHIRYHTNQSPSANLFVQLFTYYLFVNSFNMFTNTRI